MALSNSVFSLAGGEIRVSLLSLCGSQITAGNLLNLFLGYKCKAEKPNHEVEGLIFSLFHLNK